MAQDEALIGMSMLYDSDRYCVVYFPYVYEGQDTHGIEIVDKHENAEVFLFPPFRDVMDNALARWKIFVPSQEEVEAFLSDITSLAMHPLMLH